LTPRPPPPSLPLPPLPPRARGGGSLAILPPHNPPCAVVLACAHICPHRRRLVGRVPTGGAQCQTENGMCLASQVNGARRPGRATARARLTSRTSSRGTSAHPRYRCAKVVRRCRAEGRASPTVPNREPGHSVATAAGNRSAMRAGSCWRATPRRRRRTAHFSPGRPDCRTNRGSSIIQ
jgi:hypothetical protein